jgi:hypothetical protein
MSAKKFTQNDLDISLKYISPSVYPGLYNKEDIPEGLTYVDRQIISIDSFQIDDEQSLDKSIASKSRHLTPDEAATQSARAAGRGESADRVFHSVRTFGFKLDTKPMSVAIFPNNLIYLINGRTRMQELNRHGFKNIIADVYRCNSWEAYHDAKQLFNVREDPYSPHTMEDIVQTCQYAIKRGWIKNTYDEIKKKVDIVAPSCFSPNEINKIVLRSMAGKIGTSVSWTTKAAYKELRTWGYVDNENNNGIYYFVYSSEGPVKAIPAASKYLMEDLAGKKVKELRVVIHTSTLQGADPEQSWKNKIDSFRTAWKNYMQMIKDAMFTKDSEFLHKVKLFGALPAVDTLASEYPMDRVVMFHVGKLKNHLFSELSMNNGLSTALGLYEEEGDELEEV